MTGEEVNSRLHILEQEIAADCLTGATTAEAYNLIVGLDGKPTGPVVDIGAGASPWVGWLVDHGVDAYAVDRLYENEEKLEESIQASNEVVLAQTPSSYRATLERALQSFRQSFQVNRERYVPGWFTNLPFPDDFSELTVALNSVSDMGKDADILLASIVEGVRITRPGGRFVMAPFHTSDGLNSRFSRQHQKVLGKLKAMNIGEIRVAKDIPQYLSARLIIEKR